MASSSRPRRDVENLLDNSSSLQRDDDFDIDQYCDDDDDNASICTTNAVIPNIGEDEFFEQFKEIEMPKNSKSSAKKAAPAPLGNNFSIFNAVSPCSSPQITKAAVLKKVKTPKRRSKKVIDDFVQPSPKRFKPSCNNKECRLSVGLLQEISTLIGNNPANQEEDDDDCYNDDEEDDDSNDEDYDDYDDDEPLMPFPNLADEINFDVNAIYNRRYRGRLVTELGETGIAQYRFEKKLTEEAILNLYNALINIPKGQSQRDPPGLSVPLMAHQKQGLQWMLWREKQTPSGGILADDMGLGKTIQLIALVRAAKVERLRKEKRDGVISTNVDSFDDEDWGERYDPDEIHEGGTLVVCPATLVKQWEREIYDKCKQNRVSVFMYHGPERKVSARRLSKYDMVITSYNLVAQEHKLFLSQELYGIKKDLEPKLFKINWERVALDEAHYIRNRITKICKAVCDVKRKSSWALTGTPIQNKQEDFYSLIKFLKLEPFDNYLMWRAWVGNNANSGKKRLFVIAKATMLRREKKALMEKGLMAALPDKSVDVVSVELDREERIIYQKVLLYSQVFFHHFLSQKRTRQFLHNVGDPSRLTFIEKEIPEKVSKLLKIMMENHYQIHHHFILVLLLRLRQICCHPPLINDMVQKEDLGLSRDQTELSVNDFLLSEIDKLMIKEAEDEECPEQLDEQKENKSSTNENKKYGKFTKNLMSKSNPVFRDERKSSKVKAVLKKVQEIVENGEKVIVVSQWTGFLNVIAHHLEGNPDVEYAKFTGDVNIQERQRVVDRLNDDCHSLNVLLLSLSAGGVGLNLVGANNLLLIDIHWNPQLENQAQDRIYRFGQKHNVRIHKFLCAETIEEKIRDLQLKKLQIADGVLEYQNDHNALSIDDLKLLFS